MIAIGADVHKRQCTLAVQGADGELRMLPAMENTRENWLELLAKLPPEAEIALEVSTSGYFAMSVLEEAGWRDRAHWVHTAGIDSLRKQKNDRLDAKRLARKLSVADREPLPEAWFPPPAIRALRLRARQRCWLAVLRAQGKNRLQSLLQMHGLRPEVTDVFGVTGQRWLAEQKLPAPTRESVDQILRLDHVWTQELAMAEGRLHAVQSEFPEIRRLQTMPGIGPILAPVIWGEIGQIDRFSSASALVNYTGLVPSLYASGEVSVQGPITHQGSAWLRWALIAAANAVIRGDSPFADRYHRLRRRKKGNVAKTAIARSLARCVYGVLKHGVDYQEERWGRRVGALEQEA